MSEWVLSQPISGDGRELIKRIALLMVQLQASCRLVEEKFWDQTTCPTSFSHFTEVPTWKAGLELGDNIPGKAPHRLPREISSKGGCFTCPLIIVQSLSWTDPSRGRTVCTKVLAPVCPLQGPSYVQGANFKLHRTSFTASVFPNFQVNLHNACHLSICSCTICNT